MPTDPPTYLSRAVHRLLLALLVALAASTASAQGALVADPTPFVGATDTTLVLRNVGAGPVPIDSARFTSSVAAYGEEYNGSGWALLYTAYVGGEQQRGDLVCDPRPEWPCNGLEAFTLAPGDSVVFDSFVLYCASCRGVGSRPSGVNDTLLVYSGGAPEPLAVPFIGVGIVLPSERGPDAPSARLDVYPNPAPDRITARLDVAVAGELEAAVYDATGRFVAASTRGVYGPGSAAVPVDVEALPPGVYVVEVRGRLVTGGPVHGTAPFVVVE